MPVVKPKDAAATIIYAQRKNLEEISIPRHLIPGMKFVNLFPKKAGENDLSILKSYCFIQYKSLGNILKDFFEAYVESDK